MAFIEHLCRRAKCQKPKLEISLWLLVIVRENMAKLGLKAGLFPLIKVIAVFKFAVQPTNRNLQIRIVVETFCRSGLLNIFTMMTVRLG